MFTFCFSPHPFHTWLVGSINSLTHGVTGFLGACKLTAVASFKTALPAYIIKEA